MILLVFPTSVSFQWISFNFLFLVDHSWCILKNNEGKHQMSYKMSRSVHNNKVGAGAGLVNNTTEVKESQDILLRRLVNKG